MIKAIATSPVVTTVSALLAFYFGFLAWDLLTMPLSNGMMKRCIPCVVRCVEGAAVLEEQVYHRCGPDRRGAVDGVLPTLVTNTG